jgi:hypothetical protein
MHTTRGEYTNAKVKWVRDMCVTCLSGEQGASLLSTRHVTLRKTIATRKHNINTPYKLNQIILTIERCLFNGFTEML